MRSNIVKCLSSGIKKEIRSVWEEENVTKTSLAATYEVSVRTISRVLLEKDESADEHKLTGYSALLCSTSVSIYKEDDCKVVDRSAPNFKTVREIITAGDFSQECLHEAFSILSVPIYIERFTEGLITVDHKTSTMYYGSFKVEHYLADVVFNKLSTGETVLPLVRFIENLMSNPKKNVVKELYEFLKHNCISINDDGSIKAYKGVRGNYLDKQTSTIDNSVGVVVKMPYLEVDDNPDNTCSYGLHVGSREYADMWGERTMEVKVWPKDVVSVPYDYDGAKCRCCEYKVVGEC